MVGRVGHKNEKIDLANGTFLVYKFRNFFRNLKKMIFTYLEIGLKNH